MNTDPNRPLHVSPGVDAAAASTRTEAEVREQMARHEGAALALLDSLWPQTPSTAAAAKFLADESTAMVLERLPDAYRQLMTQLLKLAVVEGFNGGMEHANALYLRGFARVAAKIEGKPLT